MNCSTTFDTFNAFLFAPSGSRGLAKVDFHPFGSTFIFSNDEITRVVTC